MDSREWEELRATMVKLEAIRLRDPESFRCLRRWIETLAGEAEPEAASRPPKPIEKDR